MHRRHMDKNIPTELLRALVTVVDSGGFTRAADALNLTQSAISTQLKRLSNILGGNIFEKGRGLTLTKRGSLALSYARRMLGIDDELLSLAGRHASHDQLIVGLPAWMDAQALAAIFRRCRTTSPDQKVIFKCERADELLKDLNARSIDVVYTCNAADTPNTAIVRWIEQLYWAKSRISSLIQARRCRWCDGPARTLTVSRRTSCKSTMCHSASAFPDPNGQHGAWLLGVCATLARLITPEMEIIRDVLPALPAFKTGLLARDGLDMRRFGPWCEPSLKNWSRRLRSKAQRSDRSSTKFGRFAPGSICAACVESWTMGDGRCKCPSARPI